MNSSTTPPPPDADSPFLAEPTVELSPRDHPLGSAEPLGIDMARFGTVVVAGALIVALLGLVVFISIDDPSTTLDKTMEQVQHSSALGELESAPVETRPRGVSTGGPPTTATALSPATTIEAATSSTEATVGGYPAVTADLVEVRDDKGTKISVLDNDGSGDSPFDVDSLQIVTAPSHAKEFKIDDGQIRYKSTKDFEGTDSLEYMICNTNDLCATGTVTISVVPN